MTHPLLTHARRTLERHLNNKSPPTPPDPSPALPPQGCFVSLKVGGRLRGCMGTITATQPSLEQEVAANALAAAMRDPRFNPVRPQELQSIRISIDLLSPPEEIDSPNQLDPARFGLIVRSGKKAGVLLPDLPGVESVEHQMAICREKAAIPTDQPVRMERFTVERIEEKPGD